MGKSLKRVEKRRLSDQIIDQITSSIASGMFKVGSKLPAEHVLMNQLGVGRNSLREAIRALALIGLLSVSAGHGTYIMNSPDSLSKGTLSWRISNEKEKIGQYFEARIILEEAIAGLAAKHATNADIADLRNAVDQLKVAKKNMEEFVQTDISFHFLIAKVSKNDVLSRFLHELRPLMRAWIEQTARFVKSGDMDAQIEQHSEVVKAIEQEDGEKAKSLVREYLEISSRSLIPRLLQKQIKAHGISSKKYTVDKRMS